MTTGPPERPVPAAGAADSAGDTANTGSDANTGITGRQRPHRYLTSYGLGMVLVAVVVCVANFSSAMPVNPAGGQLNVLCLTIYLLAVAASTVRIVRGSQWRLLAWLWLAAVLAASVLLRTALPADQLSHQQNWSLGAFGFVAVVVLFGQSLVVMVAAQVANCLIGLPILLAAEQFSQDPLVQFAATAVGVSVFPIAAAVFHPQLLEVAELAGRDTQARQKLLARESKSRQVAADRAHRSAAIEATVGPLLQALADGTADPQDPLVRTAARIESARLRRLFAEVDEADEPLLHEVRASMDAVERLGVAVTLETRGRVPSLPVLLRRAVLDAPMSTLASAVATARVVIMAEAQSLSVSVVTDGPPGPRPPEIAGGATHTTTTTAGNVTWTQTSWQPAS